LPEVLDVRRPPEFVACRLAVPKVKRWIHLL
jgi:hypothetical protein